MQHGGPLSAMRMDDEMKLSAHELEFMAEDELVEVVPRFAFDEVNMACGSYGPFQPMMPTKVPLWFAIQLVQRNLAKVTPPQWLQEEEVQELWNREDASRKKQELQEVPFHYQEIAALILRHCSDSFDGREDKVRLTLKDIEDLREDKLRESLRGLDDDHPVVNISNISAMELNKIRPFLINALHQFRDLARAETAV
eukprot:CAMPEP_0173442766 /NCGR_PEP_ID=MMETSP1357-20121228/28133_1 /TAXON_ID=77926 /ORGANISM="Hemiselmis rufescens, Strain PCC563" /LENGTH=196 /DNA_ID=CAMNT_0014408575 /DNA_START=99 /DNA_END=685 /DNA_ORIENTATION=-